jgi:pimeloyl-ACP methyl ester carboxylesterase
MSARASSPDLSEDYAEGDGVRLFYVRAGEGPLMLFLHGAPDDWSLYEAQLQEFRRDHLVVAPNLRGFPPSDAPEAVEAYAMPRLLNDIHALLRHFRRERCILVSND